MRRLSAEAAGDALRGLFWLVRARRLYARLSTPELLARLRAPAPAPPPGGPRRAPEAERLRRTLAGWSRRLPWRSDCLVQSLAARLWLDAAGAPCVFRLGARRTQAGLAAHAWIEIDGEVATGGRAVAGFAGFAEAGEEVAETENG